MASIRYFSENCGVIVQAKDASIESVLHKQEIGFIRIGKVSSSPTLSITNAADHFEFSIPELRDVWYVALHWGYAV